MHAVPIAKKNGECSPPPLLPSSAVVNGQDSDLLWQGGHRVCTMQNNHPATASNGGVIDGFSSASNADAQSRQSWHKNVVVQQAEGNGINGIFSSLWRKRSRTTQNQRLANNKRNPRSPRHAASIEEASAASITKTGNQQHAWMTLRVPTTGAGHLGNMHQQPPNPVGFRQSQPQPPAHLGQPAIMVVQSKTLGRQPNNNNVNGHIVMPNPDDILPKEAWTDFSGNDEWPRFSGIVSAAAAAAADRKSASALTSDNNNSSTRLYVNCPSSSSSRVVQRGLISDSKDDEDADQDAANGNRENSLNSALNGLRRPPPSPAAMTSALDDNEGQQHSWNENFSQQIENNLMASVASVSHSAVGVGALVQELYPSILLGRKTKLLIISMMHQVLQ